MSTHRHISRRGATAVVAGLLIVAACSSGSDEVTTVERDDGDEASTTSLVASTVAPTSVAPSSVAPSSVAPSSVQPATTAGSTPPSTAAPSTTSVTTPPSTVDTTLAPTTTVPTAPAPARVVAVSDADLVEIDVASGEVIRTIVPSFEGDGVFRGDLRLSRDGSRLFFSESYEDGWYGCESSVGNVGVVVIETGELNILAPGGNFSQSPNGPYAAYLTSNVCEPDPEAPDFWVLTPSDRVVVEDEAFGGTIEFITNSPPTDYRSPGALAWMMFEDDHHLLVATMAGDLHRVAIDGPTTVQDHPVVASGLDAQASRPVGVTAGTAVLVEYGDEGSSDLVSLDLTAGTATRLATAESYLAAALSDDGHIVVSATTPVTVDDGAVVTVLTAAVPVYDIDW